MGKFAGSKVTIRPARVFAGDFMLELFSATLGTSSGGHAEVVVHWKIVDSDRGYNNARLFEHLVCSDLTAEERQARIAAGKSGDSGYEVTIQKLAAMGLDHNLVDGNTLKQAAASALELFKPALRVNARCFEQESTNGGDNNYRVRRYLGLAK